MVADGALAVMGNHDEAALRGPGPRMNPYAAAAIDWTRGRLRSDHLAFLATLPLRAELDGTLLVHASARDPAGWYSISGAAEAARNLSATTCRRILCGHMHQQALYRAGDEGRAPITPGAPIALGTRRWLAIAGSVGQPRDGNPAACYAVWDEADASLTFHRVPYDHATAAAKIAAAGLPPHLAQRLHHGV